MKFNNLKKCLDKFVEEYNTPGVDCIVYKDHKILFRYFKGMSDIENNREMNGEELYLIFSMTKMLTCTSALQLYEQGKYKMSDPISLYLPEFDKMKLSDGELNGENAAKITTGSIAGEAVENEQKGYAKNKITVKDLFTMSGGLDYALNDTAIKNALEQGKKSTRELVSAMSEKVLGFEPGTRFRYSLCHDVLGALIEVWSGKKLGEYMRENIFEPLGMKNTFFGLPKEQSLIDRMAVRYTFGENQKPQKQPLECVYNLSSEYQSGGAGLTSCTEDYALFLDALACGGMGLSGNRILNKETVKLMGTNHLSSKALEDFNQLRNGYGYGLGVRTHINKEQSGSLSPIGEFGWDGAAGAFSMVDTKNRISLTYFQHIHGWNIEIQSEMRNALYQDLVNEEEQGNMLL